MPERDGSDRWSRWLLAGREGGHVAGAIAGRAGAGPRSDPRTRRGGPGRRGAGDGLIAFAALDRVGPDGRVIFADVSGPLLDHAREIAEAAGHAARCSFLKCSAEDLAPVRGASVDVVTIRSVLISVEEKRRAFAEFRPNNRTPYGQRPRIGRS